jgi:hypothetical protein
MQASASCGRTGGGVLRVAADAATAESANFTVEILPRPVSAPQPSCESAPNRGSGDQRQTLSPTPASDLPGAGLRHRLRYAHRIGDGHVVRHCFLILIVKDQVEMIMSLAPATYALPFTSSLPVTPARAAPEELICEYISKSRFGCLADDVTAIQITNPYLNI